MERKHRDDLKERENSGEKRNSKKIAMPASHKGGREEAYCG